MKQLLKKISQPILYVTLAFVLLFSQFNLFSTKASVVEVPIISLNDFHGSIDETSKNAGLVKIAQLIEDERAANSNLIFLSAGDSYQGTAQSNLTLGMSIAQAFGLMKMDALVPGNHEFDWNTPSLNYIPTWESIAGYVTLGANIVDKTTGNVKDYVKPYTVIIRDGKKIGVLGLSTIETAFKTTPQGITDVTFKDYMPLTQQYINELKTVENVDAVVLVSHLSAYQNASGVVTGESADLLAQLTGVDVMFTGHSHQVVNGSVNGVPILQGNAYGRNLSKATLTFASDNTVTVTPEIIKANNVTVDLTNPVVNGVKTLVDDTNSGLAPLLGKLVTTSANALDHDRYLPVTDLPQPSTLGQLINKAIAQRVGAQIAIMNGGNIRVPLDAGPITMGDVYTILPFDNYIYTVDMKAIDIKQVIEHGILPTAPGNDISWGEYYGLTVFYNPDAAPYERIVAMYYNDPVTNQLVKMNDDDVYKVAINDFMYEGGDNYDFSKAFNVQSTGLLIREEFVEWASQFSLLDFTRQDLLQHYSQIPVDKKEIILVNTGSELSYAPALLIIAGLTILGVKRKNQFY